MESTIFNTIVIATGAIAVGFFTLIRGRSDVWKSNYEAEKARSDDLQKEIILLKARVAQLEAQPDVDKLFKLMKTVAEQNLRISDTLDAISKRLK